MVQGIYSPVPRWLTPHPGPIPFSMTPDVGNLEKLAQAFQIKVADLLASGLD